MKVYAFLWILDFFSSGWSFFEEQISNDVTQAGKTGQHEKIQKFKVGKEKTKINANVQIILTMGYIKYVFVLENIK